MKLKIKVVHNPESFPSTYLVDEAGDPVTIEGASMQFHLLVDAKSGGLCKVGICLDNVEVECRGEAVGQSFEMKTKG